MKKTLWLMPLLIFYLSLSQGCRNRNTDTSSADSLQNRKADSAAMAKERDEYRFSVQQQLNKVQAKLDSLNERMNSEDKKTAREDWQKSKSSLQQDIDRINGDLKAYGNKVAPDWEGFKAKVNRDLDSLDYKVQRALRPLTDSKEKKHSKGRVQKK